MFPEVINMQELKQYTNSLNEDISRLERELKLITSEIKEKDVLEKELTKTIRTVDDILNNDTITNAMLKTIIDVIEVDSEGNVELRLKLLNEIGSQPTVITNFDDISSTVTKSNNSTDRNNRMISSNKIKHIRMKDELYNLGKTEIDYKGVRINIYDKERMVIDLARNKNKIGYNL